MKNKILPILACLTLLISSIVCLGQAPNLGTASNFALFTKNGAFTNTGASVVTGDIGTNIGAFSGFPPGSVVGNVRLFGSTQADQAAMDVMAAYNALTSPACTSAIGPILGNGQTLTPGVYCQNAPAAASTLNGTLILDGAGVYIIKLNDALTTATSSSIILTNGATADNVFFQVNGAVDLGIGSLFRGTILANGAISLLTGAALEGRGLSIAGAISLNNNTVTNIQACSIATPTVTVGACASATNGFSSTVVVTVNNPTAGQTLTVSDGVSSQPFTTTAGVTNTFTMVFNGLLSDGAVRTVSVSVPGCGSAATQYTAPASCTVAPASLGGLAFTDNNGDGLLNGTDAALPGVVVALLNGANAPIATATTNPAGIYSFTGLTPGVPYSVSFTTPTGYSVTSGSGLIGPVTLIPGQNNTSLGAGFLPLVNPVVPASLGGLVFADNNGDGLQNGADAPIASVTVTLLDGTNSPIATTTTNPAGIYSFTGLTPGVPYSVSFTAPTGYSTTNGNGLIGPVTLSSGQNNTSLGAGLLPLVNPVSPASLGGLAFTDNNGDGLLNGADAALPGVVVTLLNGANAPIATTTTNLSGLYSFTGLTPGVPYSVSFTAPTGYSTTNGNGLFGPVSLTSGQNNTSFGVGLLPLVSPVAPLLSVQNFVSLSKAKVGDVLTYTIVLTNSGSTSAATTVRDSISAGTTYVPGSAVVPAGTSFIVGQQISLWNVPSIGAGQSLTLTFQVSVDSTGILYNIATVAGDTAKVCTSIPVRMCLGDEYTLTAPAGRTSYRWYKDNQLIVGQTTNVLVVTQPGSYSLGIDNAGGLCPTFSCCPFIVEMDTLPVYQAVAIGATCLGSTSQNNGQLVLTNFNPTHTYQYSLGATFDPTASLSGAPQAIPATGVLTATLANPVLAQAYTVRVINSSGCYTDITVLLTPTVCGCPADICLPYVIAQTKRPKRIGDPIR